MDILKLTYCLTSSTGRRVYTMLQRPFSVSWTVFCQIFLRQIGISDIEALVHFSLAPLSTRRDIAMLGLVHRAVLRQGPSHFFQFFYVDAAPARFSRRRHNKHLFEWRDGRQSAAIDRSALGLVSVYNLLPQTVVDATSVSDFQHSLQALVRGRATSGHPDWPCTLSPRLSILSHPLSRFR